MAPDSSVPLGPYSLDLDILKTCLCKPLHVIKRMLIPWYEYTSNAFALLLSTATNTGQMPLPVRVHTHKIPLELHNVSPDGVEHGYHELYRSTCIA